MHFNRLNVYDSLLLSCGGGIYNPVNMISWHSDRAALAIGIGGTGVAALAELKKKVYQQLEPDNPGDPIPRYDHIQFLAIDSDTTDIDRMRGKAKLDRDSEFFSIKNPSLRAAIAQKRQIEEDPLMSWMDIEHIDALLSPDGAGGVRQVGRYLLISKAGELKRRIEEKCTTALKGLGTSAIDVYIFAGISGGTGSGCFLDTCYIARQALLDNGWHGSGNILGLFFLPDVVLDKPAARAVATAVQYYSSNGYAAMKELDYLMNLKDAHDEFYQNYGDFVVKTQEPPVDICHLISALRADGSFMPNGYERSLDLAAQHALQVIKSDQARKSLAVGLAGATGLPLKYGAGTYYSIIGFASAEIPVTQISTYLAAGFYRRFVESVGRDKRLTTKVEVDSIVRNLKFTAKDILDSIISGAPGLAFPEMDASSIRACFPVARGHLPMPWANAYNAWLDEVKGKITQNAVVMNEDLPRNDTKYDYNRITDDSLIGRLFRMLYELSIDPDYGPYYAARLLKCEGYDLINAIDGIILELDVKRKKTELYLHGREGMCGHEELLEQAGTLLFAKPMFLRRRYYKEIAEQYALLNKNIVCLNEAIKLMRSFKEKMIALNDEFFKAFTVLLDNLAATFKENEILLNNPLAWSETTCTMRLIEFEDIKPRLDAVIANLHPLEFVNGFVRHLLDNNTEWLDCNEAKISKCINEYMVGLDVFSEYMNRSAHDFLFDKYTDIPRGDVSSLANKIRSDIITRLDSQATPVFWKNPMFNIADTYCFGSIFAPVASGSGALHVAAYDYAEMHPLYHLDDGFNNRITVTQMCIGVPFWAYQGTKLMRGYYFESGCAEYGICAHLFSQTGRGQDGAGDKDWRKYLPEPTAYSLEPEAVPNGKELIHLYEEGVANGIIIQNALGDYVILKSKQISIDMPIRENFYDRDGVLDQGKVASELSRLEKLKKQINNINDSDVEAVLLKKYASHAFGSEVDARVRMDYFLHYPVLQQIVRDELEKRAYIEQAISLLEEISHDF